MSVGQYSAVDLHEASPAEVDSRREVLFFVSKGFETDGCSGPYVVVISSVADLNVVLTGEICGIGHVALAVGP